MMDRICILCAIFIALLIGFAESSQFKEPAYKMLTESGAVTTNGKAGILDKVIVSGTTAGDAVQIKDGTAIKFTLVVPANNDSVTWDSPDGIDVIFHTDIDCVYLTASGYIYTTFLYREING